MNFITDIKEFSDNSNNPDLNVMINFPELNKSVIIEFLKSFKPIAFMSHGTTDYVKNVQDNSQSVQIFNSDDWFWTNEMIYHFEKYDLKLKDDFIQYVLSKKEEQ